MKAPSSRLNGILILVSMIILLASGCYGGINPPSTQPPAGNPVPQPETPIEPSPAPTDTPAPAVVWLVIKPGAEVNSTDEISAKLRDLAAQSGYSFKQSESLAENELQNAKAVIWVGDPAEMNRLAASAARIPFILISSIETETAANITQIRLSPTRVSFIAGLVAILIAPDRRAGGLFSAEDPLNAQRIDAFSNGARYLCGRCVPVYAPVVFFPLTSAVSGGESFEAWKAAFDELDRSRIESLYLPPEGASREMLDYLASQSVVVVGSASPPDGYLSLWAATVIQDPAAALGNLWPGLVETGAVSQVMNAPIVLRDVNDLILSPGRRDLVEKIAADLNSGWIEPLSVP